MGAILDLEFFEFDHNYLLAAVNSFVNFYMAGFDDDNHFTINKKLET